MTNILNIIIIFSITVTLLLLEGNVYTNASPTVDDFYDALDLSNGIICSHSAQCNSNFCTELHDKEIRYKCGSDGEGCDKTYMDNDNLKRCSHCKSDSDCTGEKNCQAWPDATCNKENCIRRKNEGQCDSNPTYMLQQCPEECGSTNRYYCNHDDNGGKCQKSTGRCKSDYDCSFHHHNERIMCSKLSNDDEYGWCKSTCKISINDNGNHYCGSGQRCVARKDKYGKLVPALHRRYDMPDTTSNARECDPNSVPRHKTLAHETCHIWQSTSDCGEQLRMICGDGCLAECWADAQNNEWKKQKMRDAGCSEDIINNFQCPMEPYRDGGPVPTEYMGRCQNVERVEETFTARQEIVVPFLPYGDVRKGSNWWLKETLSIWLGVDQYVIDILKIDKYELSSNIGQPFSHLASMYASTGIRITYEINLLVDTNVHQNLGTAIAYNLLNNLVQPKNFNSMDIDIETHYHYGSHNSDINVCKGKCLRSFFYGRYNSYMSHDSTWSLTWSKSDEWTKMFASPVYVKMNHKNDDMHGQGNICHDMSRYDAQQVTKYQCTDRQSPMDHRFEAFSRKSCERSNLDARPEAVCLRAKRSCSELQNAGKCVSRKHYDVQNQNHQERQEYDQTYKFPRNSCGNAGYGLRAIGGSNCHRFAAYDETIPEERRILAETMAWNNYNEQGHPIDSAQICCKTTEMVECTEESCTMSREVCENMISDKSCYGNYWDQVRHMDEHWHMSHYGSPDCKYSTDMIYIEDESEKLDRAIEMIKNSQNCCDRSHEQVHEQKLKEYCTEHLVKSQYDFNKETNSDKCEQYCMLGKHCFGHHPHDHDGNCWKFQQYCQVLFDKLEENINKYKSHGNDAASHNTIVEFVESKMTLLTNNCLKKEFGLHQKHGEKCNDEPGHTAYNDHTNYGLQQLINKECDNDNINDISCLQICCNFVDTPNYLSLRNPEYGPSFNKGSCGQYGYGKHRLNNDISTVSCGRFDESIPGEWDKLNSVSYNADNPLSCCKSDRRRRRRRRMLSKAKTLDIPISKNERKTTKTVQSVKYINRNIGNNNNNNNNNNNSKRIHGKKHTNTAPHWLRNTNQKKPKNIAVGRRRLPDHDSCNQCHEPSHNCKCPQDKIDQGYCGGYPGCYSTSEDQCHRDGDIWCGHGENHHPGGNCEGNCHDCHDEHSCHHESRMGCNWDHNALMCNPGDYHSEEPSNFNTHSCGMGSILERNEICRGDFRPFNIRHEDPSGNHIEYCYETYRQCRDRREHNWGQYNNNNNNWGQHWDDLHHIIIKCCNLHHLNYLKDKSDHYLNNYGDSSITQREYTEVLGYYSYECGYVDVSGMIHNRYNKDEDHEDHIYHTDWSGFRNFLISTVVLCICLCGICCCCRYRSRKKKAKLKEKKTKGSEGAMTVDAVELVEAPTYSLDDLQNFDYENYNIVDTDSHDDDAMWSIDTTWNYISSEGVMLGPFKTAELVVFYEENNLNSLTCIDKTTLIRSENGMESWRRLYEMPALCKFVCRSLVTGIGQIDNQTGQLRISI